MHSDDEVLTPRKREEDDSELSLRPRRLREFIGQTGLKENLQVAIEAARKREEPLDHMLFYGPPGLGKTTLSLVCANEMEAPIRITSGPAIERPGDMVAILTNLEPKSVLFIDEIHRLGRVAEEILYPAMEESSVDLIIGKGPSARTMRINLPPFTLIGATTRAGLVSSPLRERFGIHQHFNFYTDENLATIVRRSAEILKIQIEPAGETEIARRSRGTPRIANRLLRRARDYAQVRGNGVITRDTADATMKMLEIDNLGLGEFDRRYLRTIVEKHGGGPVGVETLAAAFGVERDTIEDACEPFLLQAGFLNRTPRGRCATRSAYEHLQITFPGGLGDDQPKLL